MSIKYSNATSKVKTLIDTISQQVMKKELKVGDNILSINEASNKYKVSRDTVFKAYNELKKTGVIDSTPQKGYFVKGEVNRVLLLLDTYSAFKQNLYNSFAGNLPEGYKVDLIFHQYNELLFETILRESIGKYSVYVVMNFSDTQFSDTLKLIPSGRLLLLDFGNFEKSELNYICQDFDAALYNCLTEALPVLTKYRKLIYIKPQESNHPESSKSYFRQFCSDNGFESEIYSAKTDWQRPEKGNMYLCITADDMVKVIKMADESKLEIGQEAGILMYNDDPVFDVIKNGISSVSIDFGLMGEKAAQFVKTRCPIQEYLPTNLILRGSV